MTKPLVSVIIPTYNRAELLKRAIESTLAQTYKNIQVVVVDDGSEDNTPEVVRSFKDSRIKYIRLQKNSGRPAIPRNIGVMNSDGEILAFLDSDDYFLPEKTEKQIEVLMSSEGTGLVYCDALIETENGTKLAKMPELKGYVYKEMLKFPKMFLPIVLVKKNIVLQSGLLDERKIIGEDTKFLVRASRITSFDYIPEPLCVINRKSSLERLTMNTKVQIKEFLTLLLEFKDEILRELGKEELSFRFNRLAWTSYLLGYKNLALKSLILSFLYTKNIRDFAKAILVLLNLYEKYMREKYHPEKLEEFRI